MFEFPLHIQALTININNEIIKGCLYKKQTEKKLYSLDCGNNKNWKGEVLKENFFRIYLFIYLFIFIKRNPVIVTFKKFQKFVLIIV